MAKRQHASTQHKEPSPMSTVAFRAALAIAAVAIAGLAYWIVGQKPTWFGIQVSQGQAAWSAVSAQIVAAVYKWGVGNLSRYSPPAETEMSDGKPALTVQSNHASK